MLRAAREFLHGKKCQGVRETEVSVSITSKSESISQANCAECGTDNFGMAIARRPCEGCIQGAKMIVWLDECDYCRSSIFSGQRWVREKIYDPALNGRDPSYHCYHAEPLAGEEGSCWEKHEMEREIARMTVCSA